MSSRLQRRCDAAIRKIRHIDGIIDALLNKVKGYYVDLKNKLSSVGWGRKILFILGRLIKTISIVSMGTNAVNLVRVKIMLEDAKKECASFLHRAGADESLASEFAGGVDKEFKGLVLKHIVAQIINLCSAIVGYLVEKAAIPGKV